MNHNIDYLTMWDKRQDKFELVGKLVDYAIYESGEDRKIRGKFLVFHATDHNYFALQFQRMVVNGKNDFIIFNSESDDQNRYIHRQISLPVNGPLANPYVRVMNLPSIGGIFDFDMKTLHIFNRDVEFSDVREIDAQSFNFVMESFFQNPVNLNEDNTYMLDIHRQFFGNIK